MRPLFAVLVLLAATVPARAAVVADLSLAEVIARSDNVVIGTVASQRVVELGPDLVTETTIVVEQVLRGAVVEHLVVSQLGGTLGERTEDVPGDARLAVGDRLVVMTRHRASGRNVLVGMGLGVYQLNGSEARQRIDATLMRRDGSVTSAGVTRSVLITEIARVAHAMRTAERP